jgi:hypothetical protein
MYTVKNPKTVQLCALFTDQFSQKQKEVGCWNKNKK